MRATAALLVTLCLATVTVSCNRPEPRSAANDVDLQRDLTLAATSSLALPAPRVDPANFSQLESAPNAARRPSTRAVRGADRQAMAAAAAHLSATSIPQVTATAGVALMATQAVSPVAGVGADPVATAPRAGNATGGGNAGDGGADQGRGWGDIGPIIGVVIRGGGVDGDHCEPHGPRRTPGVYLPPPGGVGAGTRFPAFPRPRGGGVIHP